MCEPVARARRQHQLPDPERLALARKAVGYRLVRLNPKGRTVELLAPDMRLDLGGIGKGYAVDQAVQTLKRLGLGRALVEGGGDVMVGEPPPGKPGWRIELAPLDVTNAPPGRFLLLKNAAISTSSDLYQRLEIEGKRYSHIVDPRTGIGLTNHSLVNVIARRGATADSLTKVVSVLGPDKGLRVVEATPGAAARLMRDPGGKLETYESSRFKRYTGLHPGRKEQGSRPRPVRLPVRPLPARPVLPKPCQSGRKRRPEGRQTRRRSHPPRHLRGLPSGGFGQSLNQLLRGEPCPSSASEAVSAGSGVNTKRAPGSAVL